MAKAGKTRGWYTFEDGYYVWLNGLSSNEKMILFGAFSVYFFFMHFLFMRMLSV